MDENKIIPMGTSRLLDEDLDEFDDLDLDDLDLDDLDLDDIDLDDLDDFDDLEELESYNENNYTNMESSPVSQANIMDAGPEDLLIAQIDAFRERATLIQNMIREKQQIVAELERQVEEKEAANQELQLQLLKKQEEADEIVSTVDKQVERMLKTVKRSMDNLEENIREQVASNQEATAEQIAANKAATDEQNRSLKETLYTLNDGLTSIHTDLSEKTHTESVQLYRMLQDLIQEHDNNEEAAQFALHSYESLKKKNTVETVLLIISILISVSALVFSLGIF